MWVYALFGILVGILFFLTQMYINQKTFDNAPKEDKYIMAKKLFKKGNYDESIKIFVELEDYKDSKKYLQKAGEKKYGVF